MTAVQISKSELAKVPYLPEDLRGAPVIPLLPFWDGERWRLWIPAGEGRLREIKPIDARRTEYVAKEPASPTDLSMPFVDFICQHANWPGVMPHYRAVLNEVHNLATSIAKIDHFWSSRSSLGWNASLFVATEFNYLLIVSRSLFDHLHETVSAIWENVKLHDEALQKRKKGRKLPRSFADIVIERDAPRTAEMIMERFCFPRSLAAAYVEAGIFFTSVRKARDHIVHGIGEHTFVFDVPRGWCVSPTEGVFAGFSDVWKPEHRYNDALVSLRPLLAHVAFATAGSCGLIARAFMEEIQFPPALAPGYQVFLRGYNEGALLDLLKVLNGEEHWWSNEDPSAEAG